MSSKPKSPRPSQSLAPARSEETAGRIDLKSTSSVWVFRMETRGSSFDGIAGRLAGPLMARMNHDMELAAIEELSPSRDASVLVVGFGPGVGVAALTEHLQSGVVGGIDPSSAMVQQARRRNRSAIECGQVILERSTADSIPWPDESFTGALAVNCVQLWDPVDASIREIARVLVPTGALVTVTHVWAIE